MKLIKCVSNTLSFPLSNLVNDSFESGFYPSMLKIAKLVPVHRVKSTEEVTNYRPISLLPNFNKFFEKLMRTRLTSFLKKHNIIFEHQFGFQKNKSTSLAILDIYNELINDIENKKTIMLHFLGFGQAL